MELVRRQKNWDILNNFGPEIIEFSKLRRSFELRYFFRERKCYFNADCMSQTSNLCNKHIRKQRHRSTIWTQNFEKNYEKMKNPKSIQNHFGDVPAAPGHQKTLFWIELSFRRPPNKFIKIIILRSRKESQNWPSKREYWVVVSQKQLDSP